MADGLPPLSDLCVTLSLGPGELCIVFPGGGRLCAQYGFDSGDVNAIVRSLMGQVNGALMPLDPFFRTLEAIQAVFACVQAVPDAITQLDPSGMLACIPEMVQKVTALLELLPQLSLPATIKSLLEAIVVALIGIRSQIATCIAHNLRLIAAETRAAQLGNQELAAVVTCARNNLSAQLANFNASMGPLNRLVTALNILCGLAGLPEIDLIPDLGDELDDTILLTLDVTIDVLSAAAAAVPLP